MGEYNFQDGEGGTRDNYLKANSITTYIITGSNESDNNNSEKFSVDKKSEQASSPVLSVTNLPKIFVTNVSHDDSSGATTTEVWAPEIPFENLNTEVQDIPIMGANSLGTNSI